MRVMQVAAALALLSPHVGLGQDALGIDERSKEEVVRKVAEIMQERYVFADVGERMARHIRHRLATGAYGSITEVVPFCKRLTSDLREISNDKHLFVFHSPEEAKQVAEMNGLLPASESQEVEEHYAEMEARGNYGVSKVEVLDGNVGYVDLRWFSFSPRVTDKVNALMALLSNTDAMIIDLRQNGGGGGGGGGALLASYFLGEHERVPLTGVYWRRTGRIDTTWSLSEVPGKRMPDVDLYVLVSGRTFSAAEAFAYSLQALKRAVVVGERTRGGAHPIDVIIVKGDILTQVSIGNSVNPITGTNWEATGVQPDIGVPADSALHVAHLAALERIIERTPDRQRQQELRSLVGTLNPTF